ncbi:MAG: hypothetical protein DKM50_03565 [Candidatus Margulisiibacteriota bacterium]|nr:MAG: hypothetical protein DKM50_03565 [Candidatus Margulisiibacteriota bacterium]
MTTSSYQTTYNDAGTHNVLLTVYDNYGGLVTRSILVVIGSINRIPSVSTAALITANETETVSINPLYSDPDGDTLSVSYSGWMTTSSYQTTYNDAGTHNVLLTIDDNNGGIVTRSILVIIANVNRIPIITVTGHMAVSENTIISFSVTASDPDNGDNIATLGIGNLPIGATFNTGTFNWKPDGTQSGIYLLLFYAEDSYGSRVTGSVTINVLDANGLSSNEYIISKPSSNSIVMISLPVGTIPNNPLMYSWKSDLYNDIGGYISVTPLDLTPGKAVWIKLSNNLTIDLSTCIFDAKEKQIAIPAGWNQISNPQLTDLEWSKVKVLHNATEYSINNAIINGLVANGLHEYRDESYYVSTTIKPWKGYWIKALHPLTLIFPPTNNSEFTPQAFNQTDGELKLSLAIEDQNQQKSVISLIGTNKLPILIDVLAPPEAPGQVLKVFAAKNNNCYAILAATLKKDYVEWDVQISSKEPGTIRINVLDLVNNTDTNYTWVLLDMKSGKSYPIETKTLSLTIDKGMNYFRVQAQGPTDNSLFSVTDIKNYPNPFDPNTGETSKIAYTLTGSNANGSFKIYNNRGRLMKKTTISAAQIGGTINYNVITWDGTDENGIMLPSDVYIYLLELNSTNGTGSIKKKGKIVLWKK